MSSSNTPSSSSFRFPEVYHFPPFFTLQPVLATRDKQLELWRALIVQYAEQHQIKTLSIHDDTTLWRNAAIQRQLSVDAIQAIGDHVVAQGYGEWLRTEGSESKTTLRVFWRRPEQLADDLYAWAEANGYLGNHTVVTVYELHSGGDDSAFPGMDEAVLRKALAILEQRGQCTVFQGDTSEEDGIKFL